jgi:hypothetical protein
MNWNVKEIKDRTDSDIFNLLVSKVIGDDIKICEKIAEIKNHKVNSIHYYGFIYEVEGYGAKSIVSASIGFGSDSKNDCINYIEDYVKSGEDYYISILFSALIEYNDKIIDAWTKLLSGCKHHMLTKYRKKTITSVFRMTDEMYDNVYNNYVYLED